MSDQVVRACVRCGILLLVTRNDLRPVCSECSFKPREPEGEA